MAAEKKQITRNRISLSCQTCRRRKVKCGKEHPACDSCQKAGEECIYTDADQPGDGQNGSRSRKRRKSDTTDEKLANEHDLRSITAIKTMEQKLLQLTSLVHDLDRLTPLSNGNSPTASNSGNSILDVHGNSSLVHTTQISQYSVEGNSDRSANSMLVSLSDKLDQLNHILRSGIAKKSLPAEDENQRPLPAKSYYTVPPGAARYKPFSAILPGEIAFEDEIPVSDVNMLAPTAEESNAFFRSWLWSIYPIFPFVSPRTIHEKYQAFFHWYRNDMDKGIPNPDSSFMPFLLIIWYTGAMNLSSRGREKWLSWVQNRSAWDRIWQDRMKERLAVLRTDAIPSIWALAASIIYRYICGNGQEIALSNIQNGINTRAAQSLGLHSERVLKQYKISETELRRRLWWEVTTADVALSLGSGLPPMIEEHYTDTNMISELKEAFIGTVAAADYEQQIVENNGPPDPVDDPANNATSSFVSVFHLVAKARYLIAVNAKKILKATMSAQPMSMDDLKRTRNVGSGLRKDISAIISRIPTRGVPEYDFVPPNSHSSMDLDHTEDMGSPITNEELAKFLRDEQTTPHTGISAQGRTEIIAFHKWARISLSMMLDGLDCASYAPFLKNSKSRLWAVSRHCALRVAHGFMRKFLSLAESPDLRRFRWSWSTMFHPMHAAIIMLVDLHDRPHSDEAPRSRAMIDKLFSLSSPGAGVVEFTTWPKTPLPLREGGREAWTMLRKLRHKSWHKAGLDPDVLWTEEDQMTVGVGKPLHQNDLFIRSLREDIIMSHKDLKGGRFDSLDWHKSLRKARAEAMTQVLHPSQIEPGERIVGPITRDIASLELSNLPQVLLLRSSPDQKMMPFPAMVEDNVEKQNLTLAARTSADSQVLHLGDLIKKIKDSQQSKTRKDTPAGKGSEVSTIATDDQDNLMSTEQQLDCTCRSQEKFMDAAYQDLIDLQPTYVPGSNAFVSGQQVVDKSSFHFLPVPPTTQFEINEANERVERHRQQAKARAESLINGGIHENGKVSNGKGSISKEQPDFTSDRVSVENLTPGFSGDDSFRYTFDQYSNEKIETGTTDIDFDWARWDEMFASNSIYEDLMTDLSAELLATEHDEHSAV